MSHEVLLTDDAALDLGELYSYIEQHDTPARADYVLGQIEKALHGAQKVGAVGKTLAAGKPIEAGVQLAAGSLEALRGINQKAGIQALEDLQVLL